MAWLTASKKLMPAAVYAIAHRRVKTEKTAISEPEICVARGRILSGVSKASVLNSCIPPTRSMGRIETAMTTTPRPPSHCSMERHIRTPGGWSSSPLITVAPVVVMPLIASKKASV